MARKAAIPAKRKTVVDSERLAQMLTERSLITDFLEWFDEETQEEFEDASPTEIAVAFVTDDAAEEKVLTEVLGRCADAD